MITIFVDAGANIVTTIFIYLWKKMKKGKVLRITWFGKKIDQKNFLKMLTPPRFFA